MPWYSGPPLLEFLETVPIPIVRNAEQARFPVQYVIRPDATFRGFAGQLTGGKLRVNDEVLALPSGQKTHIERIVTYDGDLAEAYPPMSVAVQLRDEIDLSRGDMLVLSKHLPHVSGHFEAMLVWMHEKPMRAGQSYLMKHTSRLLRTKAAAIRFKVDVNTLDESPAKKLELNDIACVEFQTAGPIFFDLYAENRTTGGFILIDPISNATVAAGMIRKALDDKAISAFDANAPCGRVSAEERRRRSGHFPYVIVTADHPELAVELERTLFDSGFEALLLDESNVRPEYAVEAIRALQLAGVITLYSSSHLDGALKQNLRHSILKEEWIDLDKIAAAAKEKISAAQVIASIRELRQSQNPGGKVE
jgi:hypothetical protein